jgi:hypothetical protein
MTVSRRARLGIVTVSLLVGCITPMPASHDWTRLETRHFEILSALPDAKARKLARDLELFRASVEYLAGTPLPAPERVRVYAFDDRGLGRPFDRRDTAAAALESGYLLESLGGVTLVLRSGGGWSDASVAMRHEYAHVLLRSAGGLDLPAWYDEGMAWVAATTEVDAPQAILGRLADEKMRILQSSSWIPIGEILASDPARWSASRRRTFAAEAWALVHDLHFHATHPLDVGGRLRVMLTGGAPAWAEVRAEIEADLAVLDERLSRFRYRDRWKGIALEDGSDAVESDPRAMQRAESTTELGFLALALDRRTLAERLFRRVSNSHPDDAGARAGLAIVAARRGNFDEGRRHLEPVASTRHARMCLASVQLSLERARRAAEPSDRTTYAGEARGEAEACIDLLAASAEVHAMIAEACLLESNPDCARSAIDRAQQIFPSSLRIRLLRARQLMAEGSRGRASSLAWSVVGRTHDDALRKAAWALAEGRSASDQSKPNPPTQAKRMPAPPRTSVLSRRME